MRTSDGDVLVADTGKKSDGTFRLPVQAAVKRGGMRPLMSLDDVEDRRCRWRPPVCWR